MASSRAQFHSLSASADGSSVQFVSTLRSKNSNEPYNAKVFALTPAGVRLARAREPEEAASETLNCEVGGFRDYLGTETSKDAVAFLYDADSAGLCSVPNTVRTQIVTPNGEIDLPGIVKLSRDGRRAAQFHAHTARYQAVDIFFLDLRTGDKTAASVPAVGYPHKLIRVPFRSGRIVANDGTTLLDMQLGTSSQGYILRPGAEPAPFPVEGARLLEIDAAGSRVLYETDGLHLLELQTGQSTLVAPGALGFFASQARMSDDASRVIFIQDGQLHLVETASGMRRKLTDEPFGIAEAAISGDADTVYAVTGQGRLLRIDPWNGSLTELIGRTPYIRRFPHSLISGLAATLEGSGLSDSVINGSPPFDPYLGEVTMWIDERKVPMLELAPDRLRFLTPWDVEPRNGSVRLRVEAPGNNTPFDYPEAITPLGNYTSPRAGAIARQDWTQTYVGPVNTGEIIHVYAVGFGPVSPEAPSGAAAPMMEPFSRITRPFTCSNAEILYAGLSPGTIERVYQLDIRIGPVAGYQQFFCKLGDSEPFIFLTLNVVE